MPDRLPADLRAKHDQIMATPPIVYRGYMIKPITHRYSPYFIKGSFVYWGFIPVFIDGKFPGAHAGPGAAWSPTIGGVKTMIDCLHEAGPEPMPGTPVEQHAAWGKLFWSLMDERRSDDA